MRACLKFLEKISYEHFLRKFKQALNNKTNITVLTVVFLTNVT